MAKAVYKNIRASNLGLTATKEQPLQRLIAPGEVFEADETEIPKNWLETTVGYVRLADKDERALFAAQQKAVAATPGEGEQAATAAAAAERPAVERAPTERAPETPAPEETHSRRGR